MKNLLIAITVALLILHQDFWLWENTNLVFGFLPMGLVYHAGFSIAVALLALAAIKFAWPIDLERWGKGEPVDANLPEPEKRHDVR